MSNFLEMTYPGFILKDVLPSRQKVNRFIEDLIHYIFPVTDNPEQFLKDHECAQKELRLQLEELISIAKAKERFWSDEVIEYYFNQLPQIKDQLLKDANLILDFDPAAESLEEVILSYPGFLAIMVHRLAHELYLLHIPVVPRMISEWAHSKTGIDIHPGATIGCPFFIDHGTGVVVGETASIGNNVKIYQGVTLGALAVKKEEAKKKRHPTIGDNVVIYAGSTILGGQTKIGNDSIIGGNTWVTQSVPSFSLVYHTNQSLITNRKEFTEPINFII
ncbi:MAG: serine acetyltransferase [Segetibacter sp.]|nr:serine acetyltransferase [Segetibacter sp.]